MMVNWYTFCTLSFQTDEEDKNEGRCWKTDKRGVVGESPLHICFLNGTPIHIKIAEKLLDHNWRLALDIYEEEEYFGKSC